MNHKSSAALAVLAAVLAVFGGQAKAQSVLFSDNFDRPNSRNTSESLTGITDNTGSSLAASSVYLHAWLDPNNRAPIYGAQDATATNGGGAQILSSQLQLAVGAGSSDAYIDHNFINSSILDAGGFTVSLDVAGYNQATAQQGGGFGIGMSAAEAASGAEAYNLNASRYMGAFSAAGSAVGGPVSPVVLSDFWVAIRGNQTLVWGGNSGTISGVAGLGTKTGTISAEFSLSSFAAGETVNYEVFLDGVSQGTGSFFWSGTDENYIGLDARDDTGVIMDNLVISTVAAVPEPSAAALILLGAAGLFIRRRKA